MPTAYLTVCVWVCARAWVCLSVVDTSVVNLTGLPLSSVNNIPKCHSLFVPPEQGECFHWATSMRWFWPQLQWTRWNSTAQGSTILAISDMLRAQSIGIKQTIGAWSPRIRMLNRKVIVQLTQKGGRGTTTPTCKVMQKNTVGTQSQSPWNVRVTTHCGAPAGSYFRQQWRPR